MTLNGAQLGCYAYLGLEGMRFGCHEAGAVSTICWYVSLPPFLLVQ